LILKSFIQGLFQNNEREDEKTNQVLKHNKRSTADRPSPTTGTAPFDKDVPSFQMMERNGLDLRVVEDLFSGASREIDERLGEGAQVSEVIGQVLDRRRRPFWIF
jgi:hypothetical protein